MTKWREACGRLWKKAAVRWGCGYLLTLLFGVGLVYYWRVAYSLGVGQQGFAVRMTLAACGVLTAVYLLALLAVRLLRRDEARAAALIALAGVAFAFANPPLQAPDETEHFLRAYSIGSGNFLFQQHEDYPDDVDTLYRYFNGPVAHTQEGGLPGGYARYAAEAGLGDRGLRLTYTPRQQILAYLPQALGSALARLCGGRAMACMYAQRCANALFYAAACGLALRLAKRFHVLMLAVMLCPIALFMAGSCSFDGMFLGLMWIFIGGCLSDGVTEKRLALLAVCFGQMFFIKNTALGLLPLLALPEWMPARPRKRGPRGRAAQCAVLVGVCVLAALALNWAQSAYVALASDYEPLPYFDPNINPGGQLRFILSNVPRYAAVLCYTLYRDVLCLFHMGHFGQLDVIVPVIDCFSPLLLLFAAACSVREGARETQRTGWAMAAAAALVYGLTYTGMYLTSTPVSLPEINGVQARYLVPAFFAMGALAAMGMARMAGLRPAVCGACADAARPQGMAGARRMLGVCFVYAAGCAVLLFQRYYIGV